MTALTTLAPTNTGKRVRRCIDHPTPPSPKLFLLAHVCVPNSALLELKWEMVCPDSVPLPFPPSFQALPMDSHCHGGWLWAVEKTSQFRRGLHRRLGTLDSAKLQSVSSTQLKKKVFRALSLVFVPTHVKMSLSHLK